MIKEFSAIEDGSIVTIDRSACVDMDHDIIEVIEEFRAHAESRGIDLRVVDDGADSAQPPTPSRERGLTHA